MTLLKWPGVTHLEYLAQLPKLRLLEHLTGGKNGGVDNPCHSERTADDGTDLRRDKRRFQLDLARHPNPIMTLP